LGISKLTEDLDGFVRADILVYSLEEYESAREKGGSSQRSQEGMVL
jgi:hypothetical protein